MNMIFNIESVQSPVCVGTDSVSPYLRELYKSHCVCVCMCVSQCIYGLAVTHCQGAR